MNENQTENTQIQTLERLAVQVESNHQAAYIAMITLGGIYERGQNGVAADLGKAFDWYEKAAFLDGAKAYLGLSRLCCLACINTDSDKPELKIEYANYAKTTCDLDTLTRFGWPEIALNLGVTCRYMAEFLSEKYPAKTSDIEQYYKSAAEYFALAAGMEDKHNNSAPALSVQALAELQVVEYGARRPAHQLDNLQPSAPRA